MKHNILRTMGAVLLMLTIASCRKDSDTLMTYDHNDTLVFSAAEKSYAAMFDVMWNGMNQNYALWDYEAENGLDWDAVYDEFYPQFEALDHRGSASPVTDDELQALLKKCLSPLHDGHMYVTLKNPATGSFVLYQPGMDRLAQRPDYQESTQNFNLQYYANVANGEIETDAGGNPVISEYSTSVNDLVHSFSHTPGMGMTWIKDRIQTLSALTSPTDLETFQLQQLNNLNNDILTAATTTNAAIFIEKFNQLSVQYAFLEVPGFDALDPAFASCGISVKYALLKGNIAYFRLSGFHLSNYMIDKECQSTFNLSVPSTVQHIAKIKQVWQTWFNSVQQLHKNGTLGGVIIDLRSNMGGQMSDSQFIIGSLLPSGNIQFGYQRFKRGPGRYDYSPLMPAYVRAMSDPHETITEPVVILGNCKSVSMSESSTLCLKDMPNGTFIGKRTFGAICPLTGNEEFSYNYEGHFGIEGVTPVYGHLPTMASYDLHGECVEAKGITPDIEVDLDITLFQTTGRDTQIDRALQFLRTGK